MGYSCDQPDHAVWERILEVFGLENLLSIQSLISSWENLENNAEQKPCDSGLAYEVSEGSKDFIRPVPVIFWIKNLWI